MKNSLAIILSMLCGMTVFGEQLKNPGFESDWENWPHEAGANVPVKWSISQDKAHSGKKSLLVSFNGNYKPNCYAMVWQDLPVSPSTRYIIRLWAAAEDSEPMVFGGGKKWELRKPTDSGTYDWKEFTYEITTGPDDTMFTFRLFIENRMKNVWIDDISIEKVYEKDTESTMTVTQAGATPDGRTDSTAAFQKALRSGRAIVAIPPGRYALQSVTIPTGVTLTGCGPESTLVPFKETKSTPEKNDDGNKLHGKESAPHKLLILSTGSTAKDLAIDGMGENIVGFASVGAANVTIENCRIDNTKSFGVNFDHVTNGKIVGNTISKVMRAVNIDFSNGIRVMNNTVTDCSQHGIQFWGNYNWQENSRNRDLIFSGNIVKNGGAGAIWGTGYSNVIMSNNLIDGAEDVGLDLEWCDDSVITGNVIHNAKNGGISLFFRCRRVSISGNTIINDWDWKGEKPGDWWIRAGIWLTFPNREEYKNDTGHEDVTITGNTIFNAPGERRSIWIGSESKRITIDNNTINKDLIYFGGVHKKNGISMQSFKQDPVYIDSSSKARTSK